MHDRAEPEEGTAGLPRTMGEYADRWLADLFEPLDGRDRRVIVQTLAMNWMGGPLPDRESVQRLIERHTGRISEQQYAAWVLTYAMRSGEAHRDGIDHVLDRLADGFEVGGSREKALWYLAGMDDTRQLVTRLEAAVSDGSLTQEECNSVLMRALSNPPLPPLAKLPAHVEPLPDGWPPPAPDYGAVALAPRASVRGYATLTACQEAATIRERMRSGELEHDEALRMLAALRTDVLCPEEDEGLSCPGLGE